MSIRNTSRLQLLNELESAPGATFFNRNSLAAILKYREHIKIGRKVLYRKSEMLNYFQRLKIYQSTSDNC